MHGAPCRLGKELRSSRARGSIADETHRQDLQRGLMQVGVCAGAPGPSGPLRPLRRFRLVRSTAAISASPPVVLPSDRYPTFINISLCVVGARAAIAAKDDPFGGTMLQGQ